MNQSLRDLEILVVDDGNISDLTVEQLSEYAEADPRVRIISPNEYRPNASTALRAGVEAAVGDYIYVADNDNTLLPNAFEQWLGRAEAANADMLMIDFVVDDLEADTHTPSMPFDKESYHREEYMRLIFGRGGYFNLWTYLIRRTVFASDLIYSRTLRIGSDAYHLVQLLHFARVIVADRNKPMLHRNAAVTLPPDVTLTDDEIDDLIAFPGDIDRYLRGKIEYPAVDAALAVLQIESLNAVVTHAYKRSIERAADVAMPLFRRFPELRRDKRARRFEMLYVLYEVSPALASVLALIYKLRKKIRWDHQQEYERSEHPNREE
jgi:hypothetical protein